MADTVVVTVKIKATVTVLGPWQFYSLEWIDASVRRHLHDLALEQPHDVGRPILDPLEPAHVHM